MEADFSGWATKNDILCTDGTTIRRDAFKGNDGLRVPLVWQHQHGSPDNVLGHVILENRDEGVYAQGFFNNTPAGQKAKELVEHKDLDALSIYANRLKRKAGDILGGAIREVSLALLGGANSGAVIENVRVVHSDGDYEDLDDEAVIHFGFALEHTTKEEGEGMGASTALGDKTMAEVYDTMDDDQKQFVAVALAEVMGSDEESDDSSDEGDSVAQADEDEEDEAIQHADKEGTDMGRNVFDQSKNNGAEGGSTLTHAQLQEYVSAVAADALSMKMKGTGTLMDAIIAHAEDYGITNVEELFPEAKDIDARPEWITRKMEWVSAVLSGTAKRPWSRIKSRSADLTHEEARAKGYIKGNMKKEQFFAVAHRETTPTTIYKKQKLDRDDIVDVTDFDIVAWIWTEMRFMLDEEIARVILIGDGREIDDEDKIDENKIRPIARDDEFFTDLVVLDSNVQGEALIEAVLRARPKYKGVGNPTAFATEDLITDLLLLKDKLGRRLYPTETELATAMRVSRIVPVPIMEDAQRDEGLIQLVLVNLSDYVIGTDKGGQITTFDDFDIDYNQYKYLIEGRMSGALVSHKTAQVFVTEDGTIVTPTVPTFVASTGVVTIPAKTGVTYYRTVIDGDDVALSTGAQTAIAAGATVEIYAVPNSGYYFPHNFDADWEFTRDAA